MLYNILLPLKTKFGLRKHHLLILQSIYYEDKTAEFIAKDSGIQLGRIYGFLNELEEKGLLEKTTKHPAEYSFKNKKEKITSFVNDYINKLMRVEAQMSADLSNINKKEETTIISSSKDYIAHVYKIFKKVEDAKVLFGNNSAPPLIYPTNARGLAHVREVLEIERKKAGKSPLATGKMRDNLGLSFKKYIEKKPEFECICTEYGLKLFSSIIKKDLGEPKVRNLFKEFRKRVKNYPNYVNYIISDFSPYNIYISKEEVGVFLTPSETRVAGFISNNESVINFYKKIYDSFKRRSVLLEPFLKKNLKKVIK